MGVSVLAWDIVRLLIWHPKAGAYSFMELFIGLREDWSSQFRDALGQSSM
jgi:hypothetical protein